MFSRFVPWTVSSFPAGISMEPAPENDAPAWMLTPEVNRRFPRRLPFMVGPSWVWELLPIWSKEDVPCRVNTVPDTNTEDALVLKMPPSERERSEPWRKWTFDGAVT